MRVLAAAIGVLPCCFIVACRNPQPQSSAAVPAAVAARCAFAAADSQWLASAIDSWRRIGEPRLRLGSAQPLPRMILFDRRCVVQVDVGEDERWRVSASAHGGLVRLPNARTISPRGIGITSPTPRDSAIFLALALPDVWSNDPRYRNLIESRGSWERYLVSAFIHEMTHARMLPSLLPRLRALEAAIYPDSLEDNAVQNRFGGNREFSRAVAHETELLYRSAHAGTPRARRDYARLALVAISDRRARYYVGDLAAWSELEQTFLDLEGVAQWAALGNAVGSLDRGPSFERALSRFRSGQEFWSEDQGLAMILALDALLPDWQSAVFGASPVSTLELLSRAVAPGP